MTDLLQTISPIDGEICVEREYASGSDIARALSTLKAGQRAWARTTLAERISILHGFIDAIKGNSEQITREISQQMGRPIRYAAGEIRGLEERSRYMISIAEAALLPFRPEAKEGFERYITREPLGIIFTIAPWNYPYLTAVNSIIPALLAGNAVLLKHSSQTPLCAERIADALWDAGVPNGAFQYLHLRDDDSDEIIRSSEVDLVAFTGSVRVGRIVEGSCHEQSMSKFITANLELGGKDPAYVRADADIAMAVENLVDGSFFNSGQSCCGVERIYVDENVYDEFVAQFAALTKNYVLGDPLDIETTLGPVVSVRAAEGICKQMEAAENAGARRLIDATRFEATSQGPQYMAPQVYVGVDHTMDIMTEETFGPVVGIMAVESDDEAIRLMNDSKYGLTASVWTNDLEAARSIGQEVETGTLFLNRCDYLDPALAWTGVKDSGRGCSLSKFGFDHLTRPKSYHLRLPNNAG